MVTNERGLQNQIDGLEEFALLTQNGDRKDEPQDLRRRLDVSCRRGGGCTCYEGVDG